MNCTADYAVAVPINCSLEHEGIVICEDIEGFALSSAFGPDLRAVALAKFNPRTGKHDIVGPVVKELIELNRKRTATEVAVGECLWTVATSDDVEWALREAFEDKRRANRNEARTSSLFPRAGAFR